MFGLNQKWTVICLMLMTILFSVIACAVFSMKVDKESTETKYVNERRAKYGLLVMSLGAFAVSFLTTAIFIPNPDKPNSTPGLLKSSRKPKTPNDKAALYSAAPPSTSTTTSTSTTSQSSTDELNIPTPTV